jgi:hypothetical protein
VCLSETKASHSHKMWTEVSSSVLKLYYVEHITKQESLFLIIRYQKSADVIVIAVSISFFIFYVLLSICPTEFQF